MTEADARLVRPYVGSDDDSGTASDPLTKTGAQTELLDWPTGEGREIRSHRRTAQSTPTEATKPAETTAKIVAVKEPEPAGWKTRRVVTLAGAGALTMAVGAMATTGYLMFRADSASSLGRVPMPSGALPPVAAAPPASGLPAPASASPSAKGSAAGKAAAASPPTTEKVAAQATPTARSTRPGPQTTNAAKPAQPGATGTATKDPGSLAPAAARVGVITDSAGLCLDLQDNIAVDLSAVQVFRCNTTSAQTWTLATDGTLRVHDRCVQGDGDAVWIDDCSGDSAQWRAGADGTLRNVGAGGCLNSPGRGLQLVKVTTCTGAAAQNWALP